MHIHIRLTLFHVTCNISPARAQYVVLQVTHKCKLSRSTTEYVLVGRGIDMPLVKMCDTNEHYPDLDRCYSVDANGRFITMWCPHQ